MSDDLTTPFASVDDLKARWPDFPTGADKTAQTMLEDASEFILDVCPAATQARPGSRRRIVCAVVRRAMQAGASGQVGISQGSTSVGALSQSWTAANPNGDFYLTKQELKALGGGGRPKAFGIKIADSSGLLIGHQQWCDTVLARSWPCSCGVALSGDEPLWER